MMPGGRVLDITTQGIDGMKILRRLNYPAASCRGIKHTMRIKACGNVGLRKENYFNEANCGE